MSSQQNSPASGGIGLSGLLGVVFVTLKLLGKIDWPWIWVTAPFWIPFAIIALVLLALCAMATLSHLLKVRKIKRRLRMKPPLALLFACALLCVSTLHAVDLRDDSGTIVSGGTSQVLEGATSQRRYFLFQNISADTLWLNFGTAAVQDAPSIKIIAGASIVFESSYVPPDAVYLIGPTTGAKFVCKVK
ncbi:MAG: hypothetical protein QOD99_49 [Chthoniobacter sp.]|jgi:hypothetical protein|nr:hypothetical protein [Chthoniobacter sp.]